jgi:hypothetical protein
MKLKFSLILTICFALNCGTLMAQNTEAKITFGDEMEYKPVADNGQYTYKAYNKIYYVFSEFKNFQDNFSIVECDENNNVLSNYELVYGVGTRGNETEIEQIIGINNKAYVLVKNTNKSTGKNRLIAQELSEKCEIGEGEIELASFDYKKLMNAGNWIISISPDQKHLLIVGETPFEEKEIPSKLVYNYLDASMKAEKEGEITLPGENKKNNFYSAHVGNNANMFIVRNGRTRSLNQQPTIFSSNALSKTEPSTYILELPEGKKLFSFSMTVLQNGSFTLAGYYDESKKIMVGDNVIKGCFYYNSEACKDLKITTLNIPTNNLTALNMVENGNTIYLIGESYKYRSESSSNPSSLTYNYFYTHKDINATGFETDGTKKIDVIIGRNYTDASSEIDLKPVAAVVKDKLAIFFIDNLGKYDSNYNNYKVPTLVFINNTGLMESTLHFEKQFSSTKERGTLFSHIPYISGNKFQMLMVEREDAKCFSVE